MKFEIQIQPADKMKHYGVFKKNHERRRTEIQAVLEKEEQKWLKNPGTFWEGVDLSLQPCLKTAFQRVHNTVKVFTDKRTLDPARRRLALLRLNEFRQAVEDRIGDVVKNSKFKLQKGSTLKWLLTDVLWLLTDSGEKKEFVELLRSAERHSRCGPGIALGNGAHSHSM
jgi:hypothetical protein